MTGGMPDRSGIVSLSPASPTKGPVLINPSLQRFPTTRVLAAPFHGEGQQPRTVSTATAQKDRWLIPLISATGGLARVYPATMTLLDHRPCLNGRWIRTGTRR